MTEDKLPTYSSDEDLRTIDEKFLPFREKLLKKMLNKKKLMPSKLN